MSEPNTSGGRLLLGLALGLALLQGLWALRIGRIGTYDEAAHLEHVRFIVERRALPEPDRFDPALRQRLADAFGGSDCRRDAAGSPATCLGVQQLGNPSGYYLLQAAVQALFRPDGAWGQLRLARLVSLLLLLATLWLAQRTLALAFPGDAMLAAGVPLFLSVLPGFVGVLVLVGNDALAALAGAALCLAMTHSIVRGPSLRRACGVCLATALCLLAKTTSALLLPVALLSLALSVRRLPMRALLAAPPTLSLAAALLLFDWRGSAVWRKPGDDHVDRLRTQAPLGEYVLELEPGRRLHQPIPEADLASLAGHTVSIGAWLRSPTPSARAEPPRLHVDDRLLPVQAVELSEDWRFVSTAFRIQPRSYVAFVELVAPVDASVQIDGVVMAEGERTSCAPPEWTDARATRGSWCERPFTNFVRNGSAECGWPLLRRGGGLRLAGYSLNARLTSLYDWRALGSYFVKARDRALLTFWRPAAWGNPSSLSPVYWPLLGLTLAAGLGLTWQALGIARKKTSLAPERVRLLACYGSALAISLLAMVVRVDPFTLRGPGHVPPARYGFPVAVPLATLLFLGWSAWLSRRWRWPALAALAGLLLLDSLSTLLRLSR